MKFLLLFSLFITSIGYAGELKFKDGYYYVADLDSKNFGTWVYLHHEKYMNEKNEIYESVRGVVDEQGYIESVIDNEVEVIKYKNRKSNLNRYQIQSILPTHNSEEYAVNLEKTNKKKVVNITFIGKTIENVYAFLKIEQKNKTKYFAHRGSPYIETTNPFSIYPSNTIGAFDEAIDSGYTGFEFDVRLTKDRHFVVMHDNTIEASSSNCTGLVTEKSLEEMLKCKILYSPFAVESSIARDKAMVEQDVVMLKDVFKKYLNDIRVEKLVVDVKPNDTESLVEGMNEATKGLTEEQLKKIIFLAQTDEFTKALKLEGNRESEFALESENGWEPMKKANRSKALLTGVDPSEKENLHDTLSLSVGLGLTLRGLHDGFGNSLMSILGGLAGLPKVVYKRNLEIGYVGWERKYIKEYLELLKQAHSQNMPIVGWTVNTTRKIKRLRKNTPTLDYLLTDVPFVSIARFEIKDLLKLETTNKK